MAKLPSDRREQRARIAITSRWHPDDPALVEQRRDFRAASAEAYVRELVDGFPPLTAEQRSRLALLLRGGADARAS
jgi:hypothetical protein